MIIEKDEINRKDIDDVYKRNYAENSYKNRAFNGKRSSFDEYTGEKIYYSDKGVKGIKRHYSPKMTSNIDHVIPIDRLIERYGDTLTETQIKNIANSDFNLANTNEALNKSKGAMTNSEYLLHKVKKGEPEKLGTAKRMLQRGAEAEVKATVKGTAYRIKNRMEPISENISNKTADAKNTYRNFVGNKNVKNLDDRIAQTPVNNAKWSGSRGQSECYLTDKEGRKLLKKYGVDTISYGLDAEVDFSKVAVKELKISNMTGKRDSNYRSANRKLLNTAWAKENGLETIADVERYMKKHGLTWHEKSDGVTMQLVPTEINARFGHAGGVAEVKAAENITLDLKEDGIIRTGQKVNAAAKIQTRKSGVAFTETLEKIPDQLPQSVIKLGNDFSEGAVEALKLEAAGIPILVEGATNALQVISGEKNAKEAAVDVAKVTSAAAVSGGATRVVTNAATNLLQNSGNKALQNMAASNQVAQIVGIAVMLKDSFIDFVNGDLDEEGFLNQVNEKAIGLAAGSVGAELATVIVGTGGAALIPALAAMVVSTACVEIYKSIQNAKLRAELSEREWNRKYHALEQLAQEATVELRQQKELLKNMMNEQYAGWEKSFDAGFMKIFNAIQVGENTSEGIAAGLQEILGVFDKDVAFKTQEEFDDALMDNNFVFVL